MVAARTISCSPNIPAKMLSENRLKMERKKWVDISRSAVAHSFFNYFFISETLIRLVDGKLIEF